jgi:hypothetical protein
VSNSRALEAATSDDFRRQRTGMSHPKVTAHQAFSPPTARGADDVAYYARVTFRGLPPAEPEAKCGWFTPVISDYRPGEVITPPQNPNRRTPVWEAPKGSGEYRTVVGLARTHIGTNQDTYQVVSGGTLDWNGEKFSIDDLQTEKGVPPRPASKPLPE